MLMVCSRERTRWSRWNDAAAAALRCVVEVVAAATTTSNQHCAAQSDERCDRIDRIMQPHAVQAFRMSFCAVLSYSVLALSITCLAYDGVSLSVVRPARRDECDSCVVHCMAKRPSCGQLDRPALYLTTVGERLIYHVRCARRADETRLTAHQTRTAPAPAAHKATKKHDAVRPYVECTS